MNGTITDETIRTVYQDIQKRAGSGWRADAVDGLLSGFDLLARHGAPLTQEQREVLLFAVTAGHKDGSDTWDHGIDDDRYADHAWPRAARLLRREAGFDDE